MAKNKNAFKCTDCDYKSVKWYGKCPNCQGWNTFIEYEEQEVSQVQKRNSVATQINTTVLGLQEVNFDEENRISTGISEFNRVLGGGIVPGSLILLSGEPGIGKSTLLLQLSGLLASDQVVLYATGEESTKQIALRAKRLNIDNNNVKLLAETDVSQVGAVISELNPGLVIVDSIQTMYNPNVTSNIGSPTQVVASTDLLTKIAKNMNIPILIVCHMTKDGSLAGPRTLEHAVDAVLYFEGDRSEQIRILRTEKNRFGPTHEVGIFEMKGEGLVEVTNPSSMFLSEDMSVGEGAAVVSTMEGTRPILAEVQALVVPSYYTNPRRTASGIDLNRMILLSAVLEKKLKLPFSKQDVYLNVIGGLKITERSADLAVCLAMISSLKNKPLPAGLVVLGEIGLKGEIRTVSRLEQRLKESVKMGWTSAIVPDVGELKVEGMKINRVKSIHEVMKLFN